MKVGYSHLKPTGPLEDAGAKRVFYDANGLRRERALMASGIDELRTGDVLLVYSLRNLGGGPGGDAKWQKIVESMGATIEVIDMPKAKRGRPETKGLDDPTKIERIRSVWLDGLLSERDKLQQIERIHGSKLGRGLLFNRFGTVASPRAA